MSIRSTIEGFYSSVKKAGELLSEYRQNIDDKQSAIKSAISGIAAVSDSGFDESNEIDAMCRRQVIQYNKAVAAWQKSVGRYVDSKQFVNKFEKSLLLIVFADVKAGKSSLGNFISGYAFKDTEYGDLYSKPDYFVYDHTDKELKCGVESPIPDGYFVEDEIQATASIQYFTLHSGLTWVDTPGIHSITTEYEELAKDYVKYADLILFLTPSNNPFKQDEAMEINKLMKNDKPMLVTITKSDSTVKKIDKNGELVTVVTAKTPENRTAQEQYVAQEIEKIGKSSVVGQNRYISISTKLAKIAVEEQNEEYFEQSNFPEFFEQIGSVISEKAVELKMKRPRDELNSVIDELIQGNDINGFIGIDTLLDNLSMALKQVEDAEKRLFTLKSGIIADAKGEISNRIYTELYSEKNRGGLTDKALVSEKTGRIISDVLSEEISRTVGEEINNFGEIQLAAASVLIDADFKKKTQQIEYEVSEGKNRIRDPQGLIEHIQHFFGKEFREFTVVTKTRTKEIEIGDNFSEYAESVWTNAQKTIEETVEKEIARIGAECYGRLSDIVSEMIKSVKQTRGALENMKY